MRPFPGAPHRRQHELREPHCAKHVGLELAAHVVERYFLDRAVLAIARIVDENADRAEAPLDGFDRGAPRRLVGDVEREGLAAHGAEFVERRGISRRRECLVAGGAERQRSGVADAARAAGDEDGTSLDIFGRSRAERVGR